VASDGNLAAWVRTWWAGWRSRRGALLLLLSSVAISVVRGYQEWGLLPVAVAASIGAAVGAWGLVSWTRLPDDAKADWEAWRQDHLLPRLRHLRGRAHEK